MIRPSPFLLVMTPLSLVGCGTVHPGGEGAAAPAGAVAGRAEAGSSIPASCSVLVRFGSYAMGIDGAAAAAVDSLVGRERDVVEASRSGFGREGEYALCVRTRTAAGAARLFDAIRAALPAEPRGPIELVAGDRSFAVPRR